MSHSAEKCKRGDPWDLLTYILLQNFKQNRRGPIGDVKKYSKKKIAQCRKKWKGGPFSLVRLP